MVANMEVVLIDGAKIRNHLDRTWYSETIVLESLSASRIILVDSKLFLANNSVRKFLARQREKLVTFLSYEQGWHHRECVFLT